MNRNTMKCALALLAFAATHAAVPDDRGESVKVTGCGPTT